MATRFSQNLSSFTGSKILVFGINAAVAVFLNRYLGPTGVGFLAYATSLMNVISMVTYWGLETILRREVPGSPAADKIIGTFLSLKLACTGLMALVGTTIILLFVAQNPGLPNARAILFLFLGYKACLVVGAALESSYLGLNKVRISILAQVTSTGLFAVLVGVSIHADGGLIAIAWAYLIQAACFAGILLGFGRSLVVTSPSRQALKAFVKRTLPVTAVLLGNLLAENLHVILIQAWYSEHLLGYFALFLKLVPFFTLFPLAVKNLVLFVVVVLSKRQEPEHLKLFAESVEKKTALFMTLLLVPLLGFVEEIVYVFGGAAFANDATYLICSTGLITYYAIALTIVFDNFVIGHEKGLHFYLQWRGVAVGIQIALTFVLVGLDPFRIGGGLEAVLALFVGNIPVAVAYRVYCHRHYGYHFDLKLVAFPVLGGFTAWGIRAFKRGVGLDLVTAPWPGLVYAGLILGAFLGLFLGTLRLLGAITGPQMKTILRFYRPSKIFELPFPAEKPEEASEYEFQDARE